MINFLTIGSAQNAEPEKILSLKNKKNLKSIIKKIDVCEIRNTLELLYEKYNRKEFLSPDPLQFVFNYEAAGDREIVALLASSLAYGRVTQIIRSVDDALRRMGSSPRAFLLENKKDEIFKKFSGFKHRFTDDQQISTLLLNAKFAIEKFDTLENAFNAFFEKNNNYIQTLESFAILLNGNSKKANYLIPKPSSGSACKRLNLMMKWLVRKDEIDPGIWKKIPTSILIIPLDTHMWKFSSLFAFSKRKNPDFDAALDVTAAFKKINLEDPCKYDFALTRLGIRNTNQLRQSILTTQN